MSRLEIYREATANRMTGHPAKGDWRWRFRHANGRIMADSAEGYKKRSACIHGAAVVMGGEFHPYDFSEGSWIGVIVRGPEGEAVDVEIRQAKS